MSRGFEYRARSSSRSGWRLLVPDISWARFDWLIVILAMVLLGTGMAFVNAAFEANQDYRRMDFTGGNPFMKHVKTIVIALPVLLTGLS